jgi:hypothetical protein
VRGNLFGGRTYGGGRVRVYGCSPGCLVISLALSLFLTLLVNVLIRLLD